MEKRILVLDNFYPDPNLIVSIANDFTYEEDLRFYKGVRSKQKFLLPQHREIFEKLLGIKISKDSWDSPLNGAFQKTCSEDPLVYHYDKQRWAGVLYLSPVAPLQSGTKTYRSNIDNSRISTECTEETFKTGFYDSTRFDQVDSIGNIYNRLILMDGRMIHSAGPYWGNTWDTGRLVQLFFFEEE